MKGIDTDSTTYKLTHYFLNIMFSGISLTCICARSRTHVELGLDLWTKNFSPDLVGLN